LNPHSTRPDRCLTLCRMKGERIATRAQSLLFVIHSEHLAGPWIDQMYPRASNASYGLVKLSLTLGWIITDPSVHILPRVGATIDNWIAHKGEIKAVLQSTTLT
jgi:hypothetical protein